MTSEKAKLLEAVTALCDRFPEWRFGQLVSNLAGWVDVDVWDVEDGQLLAAIRQYFDSNQPTLKSSIAAQAGTVP
jgi:hypothetical protein